jgi:tetratricopeptide (TPR) repeat protein
VDVVEFEGQVAEGTVAALERAAALYRGELLEGLALQEAPFEEWLLAERDRLRELALEALAKLLRHQHTPGATEEALQTALRLLALDPLQEPVHRAVMRLYVQLGRRASALRQYQICVGALQRELSVEPETTTKQLYQEILRQRPSHPAADVESAATAPQVPAEGPSLPDETLPRELPLIGREAEICRLRELLNRAGEGHGQVVAVIGEAGVGKSRLLAEVAAQAVALRARVLVGRCYEAEQILPFASWVDAFRAGHINDAREVLECFRRAIEIASGQAARSWELRAALSRARLLVVEGRRDEAHRTLAGIYDWFTEGFETADLQDAKAFLEERIGKTKVG